MNDEDKLFLKQISFLSHENPLHLFLLLLLASCNRVFQPFPNFSNMADNNKKDTGKKPSSRLLGMKVKII